MFSNSTTLRLAAALCLSLAALAGLASPQARAQQPTPEITFEKSDLVIRRASGGDVAFNVEMAVTPQQQERGLMFRKSVPPYRGMLFDFGQPRPIAMWMKNTVVSLDMLFIAADGRIVNIAANAKPLSTDTIEAAEPVLAVLEIAGGSALLLGIHPGDKVIHPIFNRGH